MVIMTAKRTQNFTSIEREILGDILKHFPIVESKSYERDVITKKIKAWHDITKLFNANFPERSPRDYKALKGAWRRLKLKAKEILDDRKKMKGTRGGPLPPHLTATEENVASIIGDLAAPVNCDFDDDVTFYVEMQQISDTEVGISDIPPENIQGRSQVEKNEIDKRKLSRKDEEILILTKKVYERQLEVLDIKKKRNEEKMAYFRKKAKLELFIMQEEAKQKGIYIPGEL